MPIAPKRTILRILNAAKAGIGAKLGAMRENPAFQRAYKVAQHAFMAAAAGYIIYRFSQLGWREVFAAMPASPWFYVFFLLRYFTLPISELVVYEILWRVPLLKAFPAFVRKRVYNFGVLSYSGEGFLTLWARRTLPLDGKTIMLSVKDNNILSAFTSNAWTVILIAFLAISGGLAPGLAALPPGANAVFAIAFIVALSLSVGVLVFRKRLFHLPRGVFGKLLTVHSTRLSLIIVLHASMYAAALPSAPLSAWLMFIALHLVISRAPFIPNQDIVFLGAALSLAPLVNASDAAVAGMLLAEGGMIQVMNLVLFFATSYLGRKVN